MDDYYRGGTNLKPRPFEIRIDPVTGMVQPTHGISVFNRPNGLDRFGGAFRITGLPEELKIIQRGRDPSHFEIVPSHPMTLQDYEAALSKIILVPA
jgi:hypothetical protein